MRPKVAVVMSGYGVVARGAETMLDEILPRLEDRFEEVALVAELVVEGALRDARALRHLVDDDVATCVRSASRRWDALVEETRG